MNLGQRIHTLLKRYTEVYVKGLGTFKRIRTSSSYDEKQKVYLPPLTYIEFDKNGLDGFDFVQYIQQLNQIERIDAEAQVESEVQKLHNELASSGQTTLEGLGYLVNFGNSYIFKAFDLSGFNYTPVENNFETETPIDSEPKEVVNISDKEDTEEEKNIPAVVESEAVSTTLENTETTVDFPQENPIEVNENIQDNQSATTEEVVPSESFDEEHKRNNTGIYIFIALLALGLAAAIYYFNVYQKASEPHVARQDTAVRQLDTTQIVKPDTSSLATIDSTSLVNVDTLNQDAQQQTAVQEKDELKKYTIIIGTHKTLAQAYEQAEAYQKDGHKSVRVITPNLAKNRKRVIWDTYKTKEERDSALRYVQKHIIADAWPDVLK